MFKNLLFLIFKSNYRFFALGNFAKSRKYANFKVISLGGRFKSLFGIILYYLKIGKFISIDGNPFLKDKKNSINIWFGGTTLKILKEFRDYENNFVNINNSIIKKEQKIFQIFPIIKKKKFFNKKPKIIFMGKIFFKPDNLLINSDYLNLNKTKLLNEFSLIDNDKFWIEDKKHQKIELIFEKYKIIKTYLREQIILSINKNFNNQFFIYGEDKKNIGVNFIKPVYENKKVTQIYEGNICIDTGSILGSSSLHPRSIQILESNGLLIQTKQNDCQEIWGNLIEKIIFDNIDNLLDGIELMLSNQNVCNEYLDEIYEKFENSEHRIANTLNQAFRL